MRALLPLLLCACHAGRQHPHARAEALADWPPLPGWASETIPFPLGFAPDPAPRGAELLRFAPGFYDTTQPGYFTYAFAWVMAPPAPAVDADWIAAQLRGYYDGLCRAVAPDQVASCEAHPTRVEVVAQPERPGWRVSLTTFDGFEANAPVALEGAAEVATCEGHVVLMATVAPPGGALAPALRDQADAWACRSP